MNFNNMTRKKYEKLPFRHQVDYMERQLNSEVVSPESPLPVFWEKDSAHLELEALVTERMTTVNEADFDFLTKAVDWVEKHNIDVDVEVKCRCCDGAIMLNNFQLKVMH